MNNFESRDLCEQVCLPAMANNTANITNTTEPATPPPPPPPPPFVPVSFTTEQLPDLVVTENGVNYASLPPSNDAYGVAVSMLVLVVVVLVEFLVVH